MGTDEYGVDISTEDGVLNLGAKVMIPGFTLKHPDGRQAILEIVGFWTPEYLDKKLEKIQNADLDHLLVAVSERLECSADDFEGASNRILWFKSGIHVYDIVDWQKNRLSRCLSPRDKLYLRFTFTVVASRILGSNTQ